MYFKNKSGQEVADELNLPLGTVKSQIRLALKKNEGRPEIDQRFRGLKIYDK